VKRDTFFYIQKNQTICVMVEMDEEMYTHLIDSYKELWASKKLGDNIAALNLVKEILQAAEEGCKEND
jgi:hypothetical protein